MIYFPDGGQILITKLSYHPDFILKQGSPQIIHEHENF